MKQPKTLRALVFEPGKPPEVRDITDTLATYQQLVGGTIDTCRLDKAIVLVCNDEGRLIPLEPNLFAVGPSYLGNPIYGTAVVVGLTHAGNFCSLHERAIETYSKLPRLRTVGAA